MTRGASPSRRSELAAAAVVVVCAVATFARAVPTPLLRSWDDDRFILDNADVLHPSWDAFVSFLTRPHFQAWHPLHLLSYWLDVPWAGTGGTAIHAVSLALWCVVLVLVLRTMRGLGLGLAPAVLATLAFGLHPVMVEAVAWASGRKEILAIGFACAAVLAHLRSERAFDRAAWVSRAFFVCAVLSKTSVLPLPLVLLALDVLLGRAPFKRALARQAVGLAIAGLLAGVVVSIWHDNQMIRAAPTADGGSVALVLATITRHLATAVLPISTSPQYPIDSDLAFAPWMLAGPAALLLAGVAAWRWRAPRLGFAVVAFVILIAPVSNVVPVYFQMQDRYLIAPLLPLAFALGLGVETLAGAGRGRARSLVLAAGALVVVLLGARTVDYLAAWSSDAALWRHAVSAQPRSMYAWLKLGEIRRDSGNLAGAIDAYARASELEPRQRLPAVALFQAYLLRDEQRRGIVPSHATELYSRYGVALDDAVALRQLAGDMVALGYRDALYLPLARSLDLEPVADDRLENAALVQLRGHRQWLARFYVSRMSRRPVSPQLAPFGAEAPEPAPAEPHSPR